MAERREFSAKVAREGRFSEVDVEHFSSNSEDESARNHVIGRNRRVGELLCYLSLMRGHGLLPSNAGVTCSGARFKDYESSGEEEAAHYIPGQILIAAGGKEAKDPSYYVGNADTKDLIGALFSREQNLSVNFNKADSYVEKYSKPNLKEILATVCRKVVRDERLGPPGRIGIAVRSAYKEWMNQSLAAYRYGINRKTDIADLRENPVPPPTAPYYDPETDYFEPHLLQPSNIAIFERAVRKNKSGEPTATVWDYSVQIRILGYYAQFSLEEELSGAIVEYAEQRFKP